MRHTLLAALPIFAVLLVGCTAVKMKPVDLRNLESDESIVMGSLIIKVQDPEESDKDIGYLAGLHKREAEGHKYTISLSKYEYKEGFFVTSRSLSIIDRFHVETTPNKEEVFITKLPAGDYIIYQIHRHPRWNFTGDYLTTNRTFTVLPGETAYWGKIVVSLPYRYSGGIDLDAAQAVHTEVEYELNKFISSMGKEYSEIIPGLENRQFEDGLKAYCHKQFAWAIEILRPYAEQGSVDAQVILGILAFEGKGVTQDYEEAASWYRKAADQGDIEAQVNLGLMYVNGLAGPVNFDEAVRLFADAAKAGFDTGQYSLAYAYATGQGIAKDEAKAVEFYAKAANQGDVWAQSNLGFMYKDGKGIPQNLVEAYKWWLLGSKRGDKPADEALIVNRKFLSAEEISKAKGLAENFVPVLSPATQKVAQRCRDTPPLRE
jgi:hypothetical protein